MLRWPVRPAKELDDAGKPLYVHTSLTEFLIFSKLPSSSLHSWINFRFSSSRSVKISKSCWGCWKYSFTEPFSLSARNNSMAMSIILYRSKLQTQLAYVYIIIDWHSWRVFKKEGFTTLKANHGGFGPYLMARVVAVAWQVWF